MSMTDPIADMLTRIRNGQKARKVAVSMPASKAKEAIAKVLQDEGYITGFATDGEGATSQSSSSISKACPLSRRSNAPVAPGCVFTGARKTCQRYWAASVLQSFQRLRA
jgi:ribosomal protein S8